MYEYLAKSMVKWRKIIKKYRLKNYRLPIGLFLGGLLLTMVGLFMLVIPELQSSTNVFTGSTVEVLSAEKEEKAFIVFEVSGAVKHPGVFRLDSGARIIDALKEAEGISQLADTDWVEKNINKAAPIVDGQKIYIPSKSVASNSQPQGTSASGEGVYQTTSAASNSATASKININTASSRELDTLPGIGPVYAQNIIEQRPYSSVDELLIKGALKDGVYQKIKDLVSVY